MLLDLEPYCPGYSLSPGGQSTVAVRRYKDRLLGVGVSDEVEVFGIAEPRLNGCPALVPPCAERSGDLSGHAVVDEEAQMLSP
jgi:hypothetical protein